ncbi:uncharacterized protein E0L32_008762 [Thyridium curvatum]|uniref:Uncharacterized protein n=1 Tax=Thyridium curvatum TaxID=1093900 RepID=A0A507ASA8_9PEZI|nr:uncharacterized protein E0L32_008762 [Thyridium curvatum]TPX10357.1 hypothetical protein E0L32_008762 [Thyridium curvatum]
MARLPNLLDTPSAFSFVLSCDDDDYDKENNHNNENRVSHGTGSKDTLNKMEKLVSTTGTGGSAQTTAFLQGHKRKALERLSQGHTTVQNKPVKRQKTQEEEKKKKKNQEPLIKKRDSNIAAPIGRLATASPPPQPGSLQDTIRRHHRARLFVPPSLWTGLHLDLIGTTFVDVVLQDHQDINNTPPSSTATAALMQPPVSAAP